MNKEFDYRGGITTGSHFSWLEENQHLRRLGPLDAWVLPYPSHTPHGRTLVMRTPSPRPLHHVKGALEVPNMGGIWKLIYLLPSRKPTLPPSPMVRGHSNMEVGRLSFPEDGGRSTGSRKHNLELGVGCVPAVLCPGQCLKMHLDLCIYRFLWVEGPRP